MFSTITTAEPLPLAPFPPRLIFVITQLSAITSNNVHQLHKKQVIVNVLSPLNRLPSRDGHTYVQGTAVSCPLSAIYPMKLLPTPSAINVSMHLQTP